MSDWEEMRQLPGVHALLGCVWGRGVSTEDDREPCNERAVQIMVLHNGPFDEGFEVRVCAKHKARIEGESTRRA